MSDLNTQAILGNYQGMQDVPSSQNWSTSTELRKLKRDHLDFNVLGLLKYQLS